MKIFRQIGVLIAALGMTVVMLTLTQTSASAASLTTTVTLQKYHKWQYVNKYETFYSATKDSAGYSVYDGTVSLQRKYAGTQTWVTIQTKPSGGYVSWSARAIKNASYRVVYSGATGSYNTYAASTSASNWLPVRRNLHDKISRKGGFFIKGRVAPHKKTTIHVQKKKCSKCKWKAYKKVKTTRGGKYKIRMSVPRHGTFYFRAYVKANKSFTKSPSNYTYRTYRF